MRPPTADLEVDRVEEEERFGRLIGEKFALVKTTCERATDLHE
jgi:hypothetical protein